MPRVLVRQQQRTGLAKLFLKEKQPQFQTVMFQEKGLIEACYDPELGADLVRLCTPVFAAENIQFIIACNHLLQRRAGLNSPPALAALAGLTQGYTVNQQLNEAFTGFIASDDINLSYGLSQSLLNRRTAITAGANVRELVPARDYLAHNMQQGTLNSAATRQGTVLSRKLVATLTSSQRPTDENVMWRVGLLHANTQAPATRGRRVAMT